MRIPLLAGLTLLVCGQASANEKLTLVLDWYINPDHAPIMVAEQIGAFRDAGLDVNIIPPFRPGAPSAPGCRTPGGFSDNLSTAGSLLRR